MDSKIWPRRLCNALFIISITFLLSCQKDEIGDTNDKTLDYDNQENQWIYQKMKHWYLWSDYMPDSFSKTHYTKGAEDYFESLLYKRNDTYGDRFSYIEKKSNSKSKAQTTESGFGFEYKYLRSTLQLANNKQMNIILYIIYYVHAGSPAEKAGLKRGDVIYKLNGDYITDEKAINSLSSATIQWCQIESPQITFKETDPSAQISAASYTTSPIWSYRILTNGSIKAGYICYRSFSEGSDQNLIEVFKLFKSEGVEELILDLRYNTGGRLSIAQLLGGLLIPSDKLGLEYIKQEANSTINNSNEVALLLKTPKNQTTTNYGLGLERLYVLTGNATASASETTILCTKPYIKNVYVIGSKTQGKNQSSVKLSDDRYEWNLNPIIAKIYNCKNETFSETGIEPDYSINEDMNLPYKPLSDPTEPLLNAALNHISTGSFTSGSKSSPAISIGKLTYPQNDEGGNIITLEELMR